MAKESSHKEEGEKVAGERQLRISVLVSRSPRLPFTATKALVCLTSVLRLPNSHRCPGVRMAAATTLRVRALYSFKATGPQLPSRTSG